MSHGRAPAAGHDLGLAGKGRGRDGTLRPGTGIFFLSWRVRPNRDLIPKVLDWRCLTPSGRSCQCVAQPGQWPQHRLMVWVVPRIGALIPVTAWDLYMCAKLFPKMWDTRTAGPKASTAPWTLGWTESQCHTVSFSHLQHIMLPKQCIMSYKTSYFDHKDSRPEL